MTDRRWLTPQEVANLTGQSANQVLHAIDHGDIAASYSPYPRGKGRWWIAEDEAERYRATVKMARLNNNAGLYPLKPL